MFPPLTQTPSNQSPPTQIIPPMRISSAQPPTSIAREGNGNPPELSGRYPLAFDSIPPELQRQDREERKDDDSDTEHTRSTILFTSLDEYNRMIKRQQEHHRRFLGNTIPSAYVEEDDPILKGALRQFPEMVHTYDSFPSNIKNFILFELLRRSSTDTLQFVNALITPAFKRDFLASLPNELAAHVIRYLDVQSLCRAACVSRQWRSIIDSHSAIWKHLLCEDKFFTNPSSMADVDDGRIYKDLYRRRHILRQNWRHGRSQRISFEGHPRNGVVTCLQFDDDKIITGADDKTIRVYDIRTGQLIRSLEGHDGGVWALQYMGNTLVSGSTDRTVRVWDIERGRCTHIFLGHTSTIRCLQMIQPIMINGQLEPSVPLIVTGSRDTTLRVWRLSNLESRSNEDDTNQYFMHTLTGHDSSVRALAAHGNRLVSGSYDFSVCVWNIEEGRLLHRMEGHSEKVYSVAIDPERRRCMSGSMDTTVRIWDLDRGHCIKVLDGHSILVGLLGMSPNYLVSAAADASLRVWSPETGDCQHVLSGHRGAITCFQHNDEKVISGSEGGLKMWDITTGRFMYDLITGVSAVWRVAFDDRRCIAAIHRNDVTSIEVLDFGIYGIEEENA